MRKLLNQNTVQQLLSEKNAQNITWFSPYKVVFKLDCNFDKFNNELIQTFGRKISLKRSSARDNLIIEIDDGNNIPLWKKAAFLKAFN